MHKDIQFNSTQNHYPYSSLLKAGVVYFSTAMSYGLLSSFNWALSAAKESREEEKLALAESEDFPLSLSAKRSVEQSLPLRTLQPYVTNVALLDGSNGFSVSGLPAGSDLGSSVSTAGDFNADGIADLVLGAYGASISAGAVYVLFGKASGWPPAFNLTTLNGTNGFSVSGLANSQLGYPVSTAGDFNGDGIADLVLGAIGVSNYAGTVYVLFGKASGWPPVFNLTTLNGTNGFSISGVAANGGLGYSVNTAGDFNGDGIDDLVMGAQSVSSGAGAVYVLFGKASAWPPAFNLTTLNGSNGFSISGLPAGSGLGSSVSTAGDFNQDGIADLVMGADRASNYAGAVYVLFGKASGRPPAFNLTTLNGSNGFSVSLAANSGLGFSVSTAGDFNGDGIVDLVLGAPIASAVYVLFGKASVWSPVFNLTTLNGSNGFSISGLPANSGLGSSVSTAGDFNRDGIADLVLGAYYASYAGAVYVLFGKASGWPPAFNLTTLNGTNGFSISGLAAYNYLGSSVSTAGDFNHDGISDLVLGASNASSGAGAAYIIFSSPSYTTFFIATNQLTITEGQALTLSNTNLNVVYNLFNKNASSLTYLISSVQAGYFQLVTNPGVAIMNFTQTVLSNQLVQFVQDGSINPPSYQVTVNDGVWQTASSTANVTFIMGTPPIVVNHSLTVLKGISVVLTSDDLSAYDLNPYGNGNTSLIFYISNLQHGQFELVNNSGFAVTQFMQDQIIMKTIQFVLDGSDASPIASVQVSNSFHLNSSILPIVITFYANSTNNIITSGTDNTAAIIGGAVGGAVILGGLIGGTVLYRKRTQDANTRKQSRFADYIRATLKLKGLDNFESEQGRHYLAVIQKLENEFATQGSMSLAQMSDHELKGLAKQVALSARNKITSTRFFGYSIITVEDLDNKIPALVQDVLKMRVGIDDTSIPMQSFGSQ